MLLHLIVTRARHQAADFIAALEAKGAHVTAWPVIQIVPLLDADTLEAVKTELSTYSGLIFTSVNGAAIFLENYLKIGSVKDFKHIWVACVGPKTADEVVRFGLMVDYLPDEFKAEGLVELLADRELSNQKILLPRAKVAREILPEKLREMGATVDVLPVYETLPWKHDQSEIENLLSKRIDLVIFTSASTVANFFDEIDVKRFKERQMSTHFACIGPITAKKLAEYGVQTDIQPDEYTIAALTSAIGLWLLKDKDE